MSTTNTVLNFARRLSRNVVSAAQRELNAERLLEKAMSTFIETAGERADKGHPGATWEPGKPLKLLMAGYSGTRNTGADVRVEEMIRQFRHLFGDDHLELSLVVFDAKNTRGYFRTAKHVVIPQVFPKWLYDNVHKHHGVIACEGSMFKSKFANALTTMMVGALGLAQAENKLAVGYGGEAGHMEDSVRELVRQYCSEAYIIARNEASKDVLGELDIACEVGTDTAWTFEPSPASTGEALLKQAGWDGQKPIVAVAPINPFWWPVRPDVRKYVMRAATGAYSHSHYKSIYFHNDDPKVAKRQDAYLQGLADGVIRFAKERDVFVIVVGSEQLDRDACEDLADKLPGQTPLFVADEVDMYDMVSVLRRCRYLVSSRYHAIVTSMPGGVLPVGVTMDERIENLLTDVGASEQCLRVDDPELGDKVLAQLHHAEANADTLTESLHRCVVRNMERMGVMGQFLVEHVRQFHPEFPFSEHLGQQGSPWDHLPALSQELSTLVERYGA